MSSSGLVLPSGASAREDHVTSSGPKAPLPASWIVPAPSISVPCQVVLIVRSVAIVASSGLGSTGALGQCRCHGDRGRRADQRGEGTAGVGGLGRLSEPRLVAV